MTSHPPTQLRAHVAPAAISKTSRFFNASLSDIMTELLQNARRAGATRIHVTEREGRITVADDGCGVTDPATLLAFGQSGWDRATASLEDPAGMGFFALSRRGCDVYSRSAGAARGWTATITSEAFAGKKAAEAWPADLNTVGTSIAFDRDDKIDADLDRVITRAALYFPVKVEALIFTGNADTPWRAIAIAQKDFLHNARRVVAWRPQPQEAIAARIGVIEQPRYGDDPTVNFQGVTIAAKTPRLSQELGGPTLQAVFDLISAAGVELVLPARKEVVETPHWLALNKAGLDALYAHVAAQPHHTLSFADYVDARARGHKLGEAKPFLRPWSPSTANDNSFDIADASVWTPEPAALIVDFDGEAIDEQHFARAIQGVAFAGALFDACPAYKGYTWYDAIGRVTDVLWILEVGGDRLFLKDLKGDDASDNGEDWRPFSAGDGEAFAAPDTIIMRIVIARGDTIETHDIETDVILMGDGYSAEEYVVLQSRAARASRTLTPDHLADLMINCGFVHSDDCEADSAETQRRNYAIAAYAHACSVLLGKDEGDLAFIREHAEASLAWTCPSDRRVVITIDGGKVSASFADRAAAP